MRIFNGEKAEVIESKTMDVYKYHSHKIALVMFSKGHRHNPFSTERQIELKEILDTFKDDDKVNSVVLYGGEGRSFSVGGNFNEVKDFVGEDETDRWLAATMNLFVSILELPKPVIAAVDGYAIGFGLQVVLVCDYRVGSSEAKLVMPELKKGIACINGTYMLEKVVGRAFMQEMVWDCEDWNGERSREIGLLHKVCKSSSLYEEAMATACKFSKYPVTAVRTSKWLYSKSYALTLRTLFEEAKKAHRVTFSEGAAQKYMKTVVDKLNH